MKNFNLQPQKCMMRKCYSLTTLICNTESQNHGMVWFGMHLKFISFHPCHGQSHLPIDQAAPSWPWTLQGTEELGNVWGFSNRKNNNFQRRTKYPKQAKLTIKDPKQAQTQSSTHSPRARAALPAQCGHRGTGTARGALLSMAQPAQHFWLICSHLHHLTPGLQSPPFLPGQHSLCSCTVTRPGSRTM